MGRGRFEVKKNQIAMYIRLSKEDDKCGEESNSIGMQRMLLKRYISQNFSDYEIFEFCDDGYTGTNFERPGVQRLLEQVRNGKINCIVVKDFSRFARDYIELGGYLEQIFPFIGVRFISVNDNYDSINYHGRIAEPDVKFKNLLYDLYSRDLSQKVRSAIAARKAQGQYVSGNSPFGYEKDRKDRHALVIAQDEADVVRKIFALTVEGYTSTQIARLFNANHVKTPMEFKIEKGRTGRKPKGDKFLWSGSTICQILRNEIYIGNIVQKKYEKDFVGGKNHGRPREEWVTAYDHHEPIIDKSVFEKVQKGRGKKRNPQHRKTHPFTGKLVCGCCKRSLRYRECLNPYFTCCNRYSNTLENCVDRVNVMFLEQVILYKMQEKLEEDGEFEKLHASIVSELDREIRELKEKKQRLKDRIQKEQRQDFERYQNHVFESAERFYSNGTAIKLIEEELTALEHEILEKENSHMKLTYEKESFGMGSRFAELSKEMLDRYIDKIIIYDEKHIKIVWRESSDPA